MYIKAVQAQAGPGPYRSLDGSARYAPGEITVAECAREGHPAPAASCECGLYALRAGLEAALRLWRIGLYPPGPGVALLAVQPVGRVYTDGVMIRAERLLTLGPLEDWRAVLPRPLRSLDRTAIEDVLRTIASIREDRRRTYLLADVRHLVGRGCYSADRRETLYRLSGWGSTCGMCGGNHCMSTLCHSTRFPFSAGQDPALPRARQGRRGAGNL